MTHRHGEGLRLGTPRPTIATTKCFDTLSITTGAHEVPDDAPRCLACHRPLTRPESVTRGFGPHCHSRLRSLTVAILAAGGSVVIP